MNRLTASERLALILLLALVAAISAVRWWHTHHAGMENRDSLPPAKHVLPALTPF